MAKTAIESLLAVIVAETAPHINRVMELHVPPVIMEIFQCIAWGSAGVLAVIAVIRHYKRSK